MKHELKTIVYRLLEKSQEDEVAWVHASTLSRLNQEEDIDPASEDYAVSTSSYTINLFRSSLLADNAHKVGVRINILNELGDVVTTDVVYEDEEDYSVMESLMKLARKSVLGEERVLKKIMDNLSKPGVFGSTEDEVPF